MGENHQSPLICVPGQILAVSDSEHVSGRGTYDRLGYIYASIAGIVNVVSRSETSVVEVHSLKEQSIVPSPGDIVTARVLIVKSRQCLCEIKCIGETTLTRPYRAVLRQEDVRATEKDRVKLYESFAPGDIILARVVSFSYPCVPMVPISWTEMQCPVTYVKKLRKVAKVIPENIDVPVPAVAAEAEASSESTPST
ncbi:hypothetical protein B566_EDAN014737 [Ephemera danica]|nr:hypothetical protein B566_EDAN014737 [Ephemera danica]